MLDILMIKENRKMRRKIYPIAIIFSLPLVVLVFFIINQGRFEQLSKNCSPSEKGLYLECNLEWQGFGKPEIESIEIINETNYIEQLNTKTFIQQVSEDNNRMRENLTEENYFPASSYKLDESSFRLVLHIEHENKDALDSVQTFIIQYKTFGITKVQQIEVERNFLE